MDNEEIEDKDSDSFYDNAVNYWEKIPATINGMLGGFGFISQTDIQGSKKFLQQIYHLKSVPGKAYALDCGAGIGRITQKLLIQMFDKVDLVEQNPAFLEKAESTLRSKHENRVGNFFAMGLQDFIPEQNKYDVIWCQWVLGHLRDEDFVVFFERCINGLKTNGIIIVKENVTSSGKVEKDEEDSSVTRPLVRLRELFSAAGLTCLKETQQTNFPKGLYAVHLFALRPDPSPSSSNTTLEIT